MNTPIDSNRIREELLRVVQKRLEKTGEAWGKQDDVLKEVIKNLNIKDPKGPQALGLLTQWHDLFRCGYLSWGCDLTSGPERHRMEFQNAGPPWFHLTERGNAAFQNLSRNPANPAGYLAYLKNTVSLSPVPMSYIQEALVTYNSNCYKATAVLVGVAAEALIFEVRDTLVGQIESSGGKPDKNLRGSFAKPVFEAIEAEIKPKISPMLRPLSESYGAFWSSFVGQIRFARNDAGHPISIDPINQQTAHALLLSFPDLAKIAVDLQAWIRDAF